MDHVRKQARVARRRLTAERFFKFLPWTLSVALLVCAVGFLAPKLVFLELDQQVWLVAWIAGPLAIALITNLCLTFIGRPTLADSAVEIDKRFNLRERLSSSLILTQEDKETELGQALAEDAQRKAENLDTASEFGFGLTRKLLIPLAPAVLAAALWYLPNREAAEDPQLPNAKATTLKQVKNATKSLLERTKKKRLEAEKQNLTAAADLFKKLEGELSKLQKDPKLDTKQRLAKLNDIKEQLKKRKEELGSAESLRKNLQGLKKFDDGPAEKLAEALKKGDFEKSEEQLEKLLEDMKSGEMSDSEMNQLKKQLDQLQKAMNDAAAEHEQAKQSLKEQMDQAAASGDMQKAAQLQKKLEQMQAQDANMAQMASLAQQLAEAQQSMEGGNLQEAQEALQELADQLSEMNEGNQQLQDLDELMDSLEQSKSEMMNGEGMGEGMSSQMQGQIPGQGMGEGRGSGDRPESETDVDFFESRVRDQMKRGEIINGGKIDGPNKKGNTRSEIQDAVLSSMSEEPEPLDDTPLPKTQRDHTRDYFNALRKGE